MRDMSETESEKGPFTGQGEVTEMEQKKTVQTENKMGVMPVDRLLVSMSLPMMISMLVQALYNIVDSIFVSRVSEQALRAVSHSEPDDCSFRGNGGGNQRFSVQDTGGERV